MSNKPAKRNEPYPEDDAVEILGEMGWLLAVYACFPLIWIYPDDSTAGKIKRGWWFYATLIVVAIPLFWQKIQMGEYRVLLLVPVAHVVVIAALIGTVGPMVYPEWPAVLVAPAWLPGQRTLALLAAVPIVVGLGKWAFCRYRIGDDEIGIPMAEIWQKSDGAGRLPKLARGVCSLVIGETGAGKSEAIKLIAYQFDYSNDIATIAHDLKRDFWTFYRENTSMQVEQISIDDSTVTWNLFLDVENPRQFNELAKGVMGQKEAGNPFHKGATQVLADCMTYLHQKGEEEGKMPDHADLLMFLKQDVETLHTVLDSNGYAGASSIDPEVGGARNTYLTMMENVREVFVGDFAKSGTFSIREFINDPDGRALMIDSKIDEIESTGPMFRLLLDLSIKFGMSEENDVNYILDEVDQLPYLTRLSSLSSAGRGVGVRAVIGIQTVGQLRGVYGKFTDGILGNCPQGLYFSPGESGTVEYILAELGKHRETVSSRTESKSGSGTDQRHSSSTTERETERTPITSGELKRFDAGDCVVKNRTDWWIGRVEMLKNVRDELDRAGVGIGAKGIDVDADEQEELPDTDDDEGDRPDGADTDGETLPDGQQDDEEE